MKRTKKTAHKKKKGVFLTYTQYNRLIEDLHDLTVVAERRNEKSTSLSEFKKQLRKEGLV